MLNDNESIINVINKLDSSVNQSRVELVDIKVTLARNTEIMEAHHIRSTRLENIVEPMHDAMLLATDKLEGMTSDIKHIDKHVNRVNKLLTMFSTVPIMFKTLLLSLGMLTSFFGCYKIVLEFVK